MFGICFGDLGNVCCHFPSVVVLALSIHFFHCTFEGSPIGNGEFVIKKFLEYLEVLGDELSELGTGDGIQMIHVTMEFFEAWIGREDSAFFHFCKNGSWLDVITSVT